jgi:2-methylisocitrate lyase-like PEP mutase family enzyme
LPDSVTVDVMLDHIAEIAAASDLPVNADFQSGYAPDLEGLAVNVGRCVDTGVAGLSIEDATGPPDQPLFELAEAVQRVTAARAAIDSSGADVVLTTRAECYVVGHPDPLRESIRRLQAYAEAGADVLYAPGPRDPDDIRAIVESVDPKPVNVLVAPTLDCALPTSPNWACGASASGPRWPGRPGELSCARPKESRKPAASRDSTARHRSRS